MKVYLAGLENPVYAPIAVEEGVQRALLSYYYLKDARALELFPEVFLDSGAYTAYTTGATVSLEAYARFVTENKARIHTFANLDALGSAQVTYENQKRLEELTGLQPLPCFHYGEAREWLEKYCGQYEYVALGGMVQLKNNKSELRRWLAACFKVTKAKGVRVHGFGITNPELLKSFPFYSADSTGWLASMRYGTLFANGKLHAKSTNKNDYRTVRLGIRHYLELEKEAA